MDQPTVPRLRLDEIRMRDPFILEAPPWARATPRIASDRVNSVRNNGPELIEPAG